MRHFSNAQWRLFKEGMCPESLEVAMEEHLVICDQCRDIFLSLIEEEDIQNGAGILSPDFSKQVVRGIKVREKESVARKKKNNSRQKKNTPVYFAAAAAITLILMGGGFFQSLVQSLPQFDTGALIIDPPRPPIEGAKMDWPGKLVDRASNWIYNFETQDRGGL